MSEERKKFLVIGGNGYIGSHMAMHLHKQGYEVVSVDNLSSSPAKPVHNFGRMEIGDCSDPLFMSTILESFRPTAVFHFAARALVGESEENPLLYYNENVLKVIKLLEILKDHKIANFIFSSTCAIFGDHENPITEEAPKAPINTYGKTKLLIENILEDLAEKNIINAICFRYFNAAGCDPEGHIGENHDPETHLIPRMIDSHLSGDEINFTINGNDYNTPDGTCIRDYVHVLDLAKTHLEGALYLEKNPGFHAFNLGSETGQSILDVKLGLEEVIGKELKSQVGPRRPGDPPSLVGNSNKAKQVLNFKLEYSLKDCIQHTLNYKQDRS